MTRKEGALQGTDEEKEEREEREKRNQDEGQLWSLLKTKTRMPVD